MPSRKLLAVCLAVAALAATPCAAAEEDAGAVSLPWRSLLQAGDQGPKTLVVLNLNTNGQPVFCVNVTKPFSNVTHPASGKEAPTGGPVDDLAKQICSDFQGAGKRIFDLVRQGESQAKQAAQAIKQANCSDPNLVPKALTAASIQAQETLSSVDEVRIYFQALVTALQAVGVPACVTLVVSDAAGQRVAGEEYIWTQ